MKLYHKLLTLVVLVGLFTACGSDDEGVTPQTSLENASLSFNADEPPITVPSAIQSSDDPYAGQINAYLSQANGMSSLISSLQPPSGAEKSTEPINGRASNGRVAATQEDVVVYTWTSSDGSGGSISVAYQISETSSRYVFEMFWKWNDGDYVKYLHAEESKTSREGFMEWFFLDEDSDGSEDYYFRYQWNEESDGTFHFDLLTSDDEFRINITVNPDQSGEIEYFADGDLFYHLTWNATGTAGTFTYYDSEGEVNSSGTWDA